MKNILLIILLVFSTSACAEPLKIFNTQLEITDACKLKTTDAKGKVTVISLSLPKESKCKFIMYDATNLIHLELISNFYMVLVEGVTITKDRCISNQTAVVVKNDGSILTADYSKISGTCYIDREQKLFHNFAFAMKLLK